MAATGTPTPNIGLRRPQGTDPASVDDINYNSNLIDTKLGAVGNTSVQEQINSLNSNLGNMFTRKYKTYTNITIPSDGYIKIDSYSGLNVSTDIYLISMYIRGWGGSISGVSLVKGSNGTDFYLVGEANQTITNITVEYIFSRY